jgi:hypothetical protein
MNKGKSPNGLTVDQTPKGSDDRLTAILAAFCKSSEPVGAETRLVAEN